jgi:hypothetical protein
MGRGRDAAMKEAGAAGVDTALVGGRKRFGFFDLHRGLATFQRAVTRLVAENLGPARFAHVALS